MVVEDEEAAAADLAEALGEMGYEVTASVPSALACLKAAEARRPDLVLMDINLGGELDGIDAARMLRERFETPVVFLSGFADDRTVERARLAGALGYLLKPYRWSELKSSVEVCLFRYRLERQLRDRERWLATTLRAIGDAAIAVDPDGKVSFLNTAAEALLAQREATARGRPLSELVQLLNENTREPIDNAVQRAFDTGEVVRLPQNTALLAAGRELPVDYTVAPISDERGGLSGAVAVIKDLTEQRRAQQQVAVADRLASLGVVTAGIAHEINNPLTYVLGNIEFLKEELDRLGLLISSKQRDDLRDVSEVADGLHALANDLQQGAKHVAGIVGDLSFFARRDARADLCDVVDRMQWAMRVSHSAVVRYARVVRDLHPVPKARVDEGRLGQVFLNLLLNAAHAMRDTERATNQLTVSIDVDAPDHQGHSEFIRVSIADTGCGMSADVLKRIFDPFFTTKPAGIGTGLGLAVCHGLLSEMGGDISVTSELGKGSCFVVRIPIAREAVPTEAPPPLVGLGGRILLVDDDPAVLAVVRRMLSSKHDVVTSERATDALDRLHRHEEFDVILCDLIMPGMSGMAFYREVAKTWPELAARIIFLSGGANTEQGTEFLSGVPNVLVQKPASAPELMRVIERSLAASGRGVAPARGHQ